MRHTKNDAHWKATLEGIFSECTPPAECTPKLLLWVLQKLPRKTNPLGKIQDACFSRNIDNTEAAVLTALRSLYKSGAISHRNIGDRDYFIRLD